MGFFYEGGYEELKLYVRQAAWLHAVPEQATRPGAVAGGGGIPAKRKSRLEQFTDDGLTPDMPDTDFGYLVGHLWDVGPTIQGGMGDSPLTHGEILAWQTLSGIELEPWEARILRRLSFDYLVQSQQSEKANCPAPFGGWKRSYVARMIDEIFG